jgi:hypothetical protein
LKIYPINIAASETPIVLNALTANFVTDVVQTAESALGIVLVISRRATKAHLSKSSLPPASDTSCL